MDVGATIRRLHQHPLVEVQAVETASDHHGSVSLIGVRFLLCLRRLSPSLRGAGRLLVYLTRDLGVDGVGGLGVG